MHEEMVMQLAEDPPPDRLLQIYFAANQWWSPPERSGSRADAPPEEPELWENPYPDITD